MTRRRRLPPLALAMGLAAAPAAVGAPLRVMSLNECADQFVLALLPPERITSVSVYARDADTSRMAAEARRVRVNHGSAEEVVHDRPDLVVAGAYTTPAARALLARLHAPMLVLQPDDSFADIRRSLRQVATAVGERARGEAMIARMDHTLATLAADRAPPLRVAAWDGAGVSAQPGSLYAAILAAAGAHNVADDAGVRASAGPDVEGLLAAAPQLLVAGQAGFETRGRRSDVAHHPLVRRFWGDRTVVVPQSAYVCGTPYSADAAVALRDQMRARLAEARSPLPFAPAAVR